MSSDLDGLIARLWTLRSSPVGSSANVTVEEVSYLCSAVIPIFQSQPTLLELTPPVTIVGDTHGQFHDLLRVFDNGNTPDAGQFLFLGDYVDRGKNSVETISLLLAYKIKHPDTFWMLRGNHECSYINRLYGFFDDCCSYWPDGRGTKLWEVFGGVFNWLPVSAIIEKKIFCVHGGLSPHLKSLDDIRNIVRPQEIPEEGLLCDLVWADPDCNAADWVDNDRGASVCFGRTQVDDFLRRFEFDLVCRAHQAVMEGFEFPFFPDQTLITLFSAPNYCYEFMNKGAILHVDARLFCSFTVLDPKPINDPEISTGNRGTPPRYSDSSPATIQPTDSVESPDEELPRSVPQGDDDSDEYDDGKKDEEEHEYESYSDQETAPEDEGHEDAEEPLRTGKDDKEKDVEPGDE
jgi:serine/threonine-protein phosphatase PP1 catalytic subunit